MAAKAQPKTQELKPELNTNLEFWNRVEKTDPNYTKKVQKSKKGRVFTAVNAQYQKKNATREWGKFGHGWGVEDRVLTLDHETGLLIYEATFWYKDGKDKCSFPIESSAKMKTADGYVDSDCVKKAATDALTKGLSLLGFNADVFLSRFDDNKYVMELRREQAQQKQLEAGTQTKATVVPIKKTFESSMAPILKVVNSAILDAVLKRFGYKAVSEIKPEDQATFYLVARSYTDLKDKNYYVNKIVIELRHVVNSHNPDLYQKIMAQYGIKDDFSDITRIMKSIEALPDEILREIFRTIHIGLRSVGVYAK